MSKADARIEKGRAQAGRMRVMNELLIPLLAAAVGLALIGELFLVAFEPAPWAAELGAPRAIMIKLLNYAPAIAAVGAVIALRPVLIAYHEGRFVCERASRAFQLAGLLALAAFLLKLLISPLAISTLGGPAFAWRADPLDLALMIFASSVLMIGGVLNAAAASLKADNDQIV